MPPSSPSAYKTFTRGAVISLLGVLAAGILSYITRRVLVLQLSPAEYGFFYSAFAFVSLGLAVVDLGLAKSGTVLMAKYVARGNRVRANLFFSVIFVVKLVVGLFVGMLVWFWSPALVKNYFSFPAGLATMFCLSLFIPLQALGGFVFGSLEAMQDFGARTLVQTVYYGIVLGLVFLLTDNLKTLAPALAYCGAAALLLIGLFYLNRRHGLYLVWRYRLWLKVWPEAWVYARWLSLSVVALGTMNYVDTLMLTWLSSLNTVAGYQVALPIAQIARSLVFLPIVFMPIATDLWQRRQLDQIKGLCNFMTLLMIFGSGVGFLLLQTLAEDLITLLFDERYRWAASSLVVLGVGMPLLVLAEFFLNTLCGMEKPRVAAIAALTGLIGNIIANLILVPFLGALGAALATLLSYLLIVLFAGICLLRELELSFSWGPLLTFTVLPLLLALIFNLGVKQASSVGLSGLFFSLFLYCGAGLFFLRSQFIALRSDQG